MKKILTAITIMLVVVASLSAKGKVKHVFYIGLDGWGSYSVEKADMPNVSRLIENGSCTLKKRTVLPSSSAPNWAAMFMGVGPEVHGFYNCCSDKPDHEPAVIGKNGSFPTIFQILRDQKPDAEIGVFSEWLGIKYLIDTVSVNVYRQVPQEDLCEVSKAYIHSKKPTLAAFIYDDPDHVGHKYGHDTPEYYEKMKQLDAWVGEIVDAIEQAGLMDDSIIIVTSDHGGINKGHGGRSMMEMETPLIVCGKGIKQGYRFDDVSIMQYDVAATMAYIFNLKMPQAWFGRPIKQIFK